MSEKNFGNHETRFVLKHVADGSEHTVLENGVHIRLANKDLSCTYMGPEFWQAIDDSKQSGAMHKYCKEKYVIYNCNLTGARINPESWTGLREIRGVEFRNVDFTKVTGLYNLHFTDCLFSCCTFDEVEFNAVRFNNCIFSCCNMGRSLFVVCNWYRTEIDRCNFRQARFGAYASINQCTLQANDGLLDAGFDRRGYRFLAMKDRTGEWVIKAGCRWLRLDDAYKHWKHWHVKRPYPREECLARVKMLETLMVIEDVYAKEIDNE